MVIFVIEPKWPILGCPKNDRQGKNNLFHDILDRIPDTYLIEFLQKKLDLFQEFLD